MPAQTRQPEVPKVQPITIKPEPIKSDPLSKFHKPTPQANSLEQQ